MKKQNFLRKKYEISHENYAVFLVLVQFNNKFNNNHVMLRNSQHEVLFWPLDTIDITH